MESAVDSTDNDSNTFLHVSECVDHIITSSRLNEAVLSLEDEDIVGEEDPPIESQSPVLTPSQKEEQRVGVLLESLPNLKYRTLCFGKLYCAETIMNPNLRIKKKGEVNDAEKRLLIYINNIL